MCSGYDQETGFGLVQALGRLNVPPIEVGARLRVGAGDRAVFRRGRAPPRRRRDGGRPPGICRLLGVPARPPSSPLRRIRFGAARR